MSEKEELLPEKIHLPAASGEGSLPWTSLVPGASEGSSHCAQASSPAGHQPPSSVPSILSLLPSSSANDRGGCQSACCLLVQQRLFICPFAVCRFWARCYRGNKTNRERGSGRDSTWGPWSRTGGSPSHQFAGVKFFLQPYGSVFLIEPLQAKTEEAG